MMTRITIEEGVAFVTFSDRLTAQNWRAAFAELVARSDFHPGMPTLWDFRGVTEADRWNDSDITAVAATVRRERAGVTGRTRVAVVADQDVTFGTARMYELVTTDDAPIQLMVFRDYEKASAWIGRPVSPEPQAGGPPDSPE